MPYNKYKITNKRRYLENALKNTCKTTYINEYGVKMVQMNYATWKDLVTKLRKLVDKGCRKTSKGVKNE